MTTAAITTTLGTDPEFFKLRGDGTIIPGYFALDGDRDIALPFGKVYPDGAAIEMQVSYTTTAEHMVDKLKTNIRAAQKLLGRLSVVSNARVKRSDIDALPESFGTRAALQILGCNEDLRIYPWVEEMVRPDPKIYEYRCIGGHIHIGAPAHIVSDHALAYFIAALADQLLGTAGTYLADDRPSRDRKGLYGRAGTIRIKTEAEHGYSAVEYRSLPAKAAVGNEAVAFHMFSLAKNISDLVQHLYNQDNEAAYDTLYSTCGEQEGMKLVSTVIDIHDIKECRKRQLESLKRINTISKFDLDFETHVQALQRMSPISDNLEW